MYPGRRGPKLSRESGSNEKVTKGNRRGRKEVKEVDKRREKR